jgi:hypothetical protein
MDTKYLDKDEFAELFPTRHQWQPTVQEFWISSKKRMIINLEDDQDLCGVVSALNGTVKSVAPGKIKVRQNAKERVVGLEKV